MKFTALALIVIALPTIAFADGGHPVAGDAHTLAHLVYFGIPIAMVGIVAIAVRRARSRLTK